MSADRIHLVRSAIQGGYRVRYGSASSFDSLGLVVREGNGWKATVFSANNAPTTFSALSDTRADAVRRIVKVSGL